MKVLLAISLLLCGCHRHLTNEEIIREAKKCQDAGLNAEYGRDFDGSIIDVQCGPKAKP